AAPNATPDLATRAVRRELAEAFPAVSEDGSTLVDLALDQEDFSGRSVERIRFFSLPSGRVLATFSLHDEPADDAAKTPQARANRLREIERDWSAAKERLGRSKWVSLEHGETGSSACPPWTALDPQVGQTPALRFARADMDVRLDVDDAGAVKALVVRRAVAGRVVTSRAHVTFPAVGRAFGGGACGMIQGLEDAFVTPDGATLFLRAAGNLGGDSCAGTLGLDRVTIVRTPK
ncbi:MAG TPA: hypothetical protein VL400_06130, partial [Polyangiaceae bacterium]|nr:hypothetical protein [Polyangiaceae bacterium]